MGVRQGQGRNHLMAMTMHEAFAAYESVRHRLPPVRREATCARRADLAALADDFDVFLLDAFGVLNIGETAIPGVPDRVASLQKAGKRVLVVTNAASYPHSALLAKYQRLGYNFEPGDVISSRHALLHRLESEPERQWGVMGAAGPGLLDLEPWRPVYLADDPQAYDTVQGFLMLSTSDWSATRQRLLLNTLAQKPRPVLVGNPDIVAPREHGFSIEPGHYAHELADATGLRPEFFGKPFENVYDLVFRRLGPNIDRNRIVMVGDSLHTDILGGQTAGVKSALIAGYGFFADHDVNEPIRVSGISPDYVLDRP